MERVYTIPLRKAYRAPRPRRSEKAIKVIREFLERHTKPSVLKIDPSINEEVWKRGIEKPPRRIKVTVKIEEKDGARIVTAVLFGREFGKAVKEEKQAAQESGKEDKGGAGKQETQPEAAGQETKPEGLPESQDEAKEEAAGEGSGQETPEKQEGEREESKKGNQKSS